MNAGAAIWPRISAIEMRKTAGSAIIVSAPGGDPSHLLGQQQLDLIFQLLESLFQLRQILAYYLAAKRTGIVIGRTSCYRAAFYFDRLGDAALRIDPGPVGYLQMSYNSRLATDHHSIPDLGAPADARLCRNDRVIPDIDVMSDLDQVVQLGAFADKGRPDRRPVDRHVGADLHSILNQHIPDLRNLFKAPIRLRRETKTVPADYRARMDRHACADHATMIDLDTRM